MLTKLNSNEATRCLCASAFLSGSSFRQTVLKRLKEVHLGAAPELGLDTKLVAQVCKFAERRAIYYAIGFVFLGLILVVAVLAGATNDPTTALIDPSALINLYVFFGVVSGLFYFVKIYQEHVSLIRPFLRQSFDPINVAKKYPPFSTSAADAAVAQPGQNLVVYSGFLPFVGGRSRLWRMVVRGLYDQDAGGPVSRAASQAFHYLGALFGD